MIAIGTLLKTFEGDQADRADRADQADQADLRNFSEVQYQTCVKGLVEIMESAG